MERPEEYRSAVYCVALGDQEVQQRCALLEGWVSLLDLNEERLCPGLQGSVSENIGESSGVCAAPIVVLDDPVSVGIADVEFEQIGTISPSLCQEVEGLDQVDTRATFAVFLAIVGDNPELVTERAAGEVMRNTGPVSWA